VTSVSRPENDETPEGTGTEVPADRGVSGAPKRGSKAGAAKAGATKPGSPKGAKKVAGAKPKVTEAASPRGTTSEAGAERPAPPKPASPKQAEPDDPASSAESPKRKPSTRAKATTNGADASKPTSKRTAASRAASSKAASARGEAARNVRAARDSAASGTPAARSRAAASATTKRQTQRVAAAITTDTTAAERKPAASVAASATQPSSSAPATDAIDETTRERPLTGVAGAAVAAVIAAEPTADPEVEVVETAPEPEPEVVAPEPEPELIEAVPEREPEPEPAPDVVESAREPEVVDAAPESAAIEAPSASDGGAMAEPDAAAADDEELVSVLEAEPEASAAGDQAVVVIPAPRKPTPRKKRTLRVARAAPAADAPRVLTITGLVKRFGDNTAVDDISLEVRAGSFFGIVGPNGAGKTTTLSMVTGLLRPDAGTVRINGVDAWADLRAAKRMTGVLPDRLRLFDRLTGAQLLYYSGALRGLDDRTVRERSSDLIGAFGLDDALDRLVADYSAGMTKKIALACAMIHAPRLLVLDEPFESVDPVSAANLTDILERYVEGGGTVLLSSHGMDLIERVCDSAAIIVGGRVLAQGTLDEVREGQTLEDRFVELAGGRKAAEGMEWLHSFSD
jgi:ABC-type multidrug transport system ATPase subunit